MKKIIKFSASLSYMFPTLIFRSRFVCVTWANNNEIKNNKRKLVVNKFMSIKGIAVTSYLILFKIDSDTCEHDKMRG